MTRNEATTRKELIDPKLQQAGWDLDPIRGQVRFEIPVDGYDAQPWNGVTDYCLYLPNGEVIAIVEAKRQSRDPRVAEQQVRHYVTEIGKHQSFQPFAFMSNGYETYFWDVGREAKRQVAGFFALRDLESLLYLQQHGVPTQQLAINLEIAGRTYQQEAIRRVCEQFEAGQRRSLLVMATGTGKSRTAMALIDLMMRANQARRILFVADRDVLVTQALEENFKQFLPDEPRCRIRTHRIDYSQRLYVSTPHTLSVCHRRFTPGFFDLVIFDEAHRTLYNKFRDVVEYFDARLLGLTATPAQFIDRDTFQLFHCFDSPPRPTFLYDYQDAIRERHLVDFDVYQAQTQFQRRGIKGAELSEEDRNLLIQQGHDPDEIDYEGTDLERKVSNKDTLRKQWEELMGLLQRDQSGQLPGKTIIFALSQRHALNLAKAFEEMYPQFPNLVQVITSKMERTDELIAAFKKEDMPRIAISVDLMDTGVDVPEVVNLVFMKPVHSQIKLLQMIGRGTRNQEACRYLDRLPNGRKEKFLIIDFWQNSFDREATEELVAQNLPVLVKVFNTRLRVLEQYLGDQQNPDCQQVIATLREQVAQIPTDSFSVQRVYRDIAQAWEDGFWRYLTQGKIEFLKTQVAPLLRFASGVDVAAATFTNKVERLKTEILAGQARPSTVESIREDVAYLPDFVHQDPQLEASVQTCLTAQLETATPQQLTQVVADLAGQMRNRRDRPSAFVEFDLADQIAASGYITLGDGGVQVYVEEYRRRVEERILELVVNHPTIAAIERGEAVTDFQLVELERTLRHELGEGIAAAVTATMAGRVGETGGEYGAGGSQLQGRQDVVSNIRKAFDTKSSSLLGFLRELLDMSEVPDYESVVHRSFEEHIGQRQYNSDQIRFLRAVQNVFLQNNRLELDDLYEAPLNRFGEGAVERWFTGEEIDRLLLFAQQLAA